MPIYRAHAGNYPHKCGWAVISLGLSVGNIPTPFIVFTNKLCYRSLFMGRLRWNKCNCILYARFKLSIMWYLEWYKSLYYKQARAQLYILYANQVENCVQDYKPFICLKSFFTFKSVYSRWKLSKIYKYLEICSIWDMNYLFLYFNPFKQGQPQHQNNFAAFRFSVALI